MKTIADLKQRGIELDEELRGRVVAEVLLRMNGKHDGILHEPLSQIIANQYTIIKLKNCTAGGRHHTG